MELLPKIIEVADIMKIYDNSIKPVLVFEKKKSGKMILHNREQRHSWVDKYIKTPLLKYGINTITDYGYFETQKYLGKH